MKKKLIFIAVLFVLASILSCGGAGVSRYQHVWDSTYSEGFLLEYDSKQREFTFQQRLGVFVAEYMDSVRYKGLEGSEVDLIRGFLPRNRTLSRKVGRNEHLRIMKAFEGMFRFEGDCTPRPGMRDGGVCRFAKVRKDSIDVRCFDLMQEEKFDAVLEGFYKTVDIFTREEIEASTEPMTGGALLSVESNNPPYIAIFEEIPNCDTLPALTRTLGGKGGNIYIDIVHYPSDDLSCLVRTFSEDYDSIRWVHSGRHGFYKFE